ncbi:MAG: type II toxin-antitoxin system mRNA interferase toxin, RelE/StbE family [Candidatus Bathyarchaeota archaeon]|nr:type II toxin-antitoxin system mRNA interferase toxin, RelE/StbE family [Candidatus Bathyarchaeota archaeon]
MKKSFELIFTKEFLKKLKHLDRQTQIRLIKELKILEDKPFVGKQLVGRLSELKSFRAGDYRVIYKVSEQKIIVLTVGHRKKVYDQ